MALAVTRFQDQHFDAAGRPLKVDGEIGPLSWGALYGAAPIALTPTGIAGRALGVAMSQIGVMESPIGSNRGDQVDKYLREAGLNPPPGYFWCMAFIHWCFFEASREQKVQNPFPKTGGCLDAWNRIKHKNPGCIITAAQAIADPSLVRPGLVFILDYGTGAGHTGFVRQSIGGALRTIEGNSNPNGSNNGIGVFEINKRKITDKLLSGFLDFTAA